MGVSKLTRGHIGPRGGLRGREELDVPSAGAKDKGAATARQALPAAGTPQGPAGPGALPLPPALPGQQG